MNAQKKVYKKNQVNLLGKCPNCGQDLYDGAYVTIPLKESENTLFGPSQESLIICDNCSKNPEALSPEKIKETLYQAKVKWKDADIDLAFIAVQNYKKVLLDFKNQNLDQFEHSKN